MFGMCVKRRTNPNLGDPPPKPSHSRLGPPSVNIPPVQRHLNQAVHTRLEGRPGACAAQRHTSKPKPMHITH